MQLSRRPSALGRTFFLRSAATRSVFRFHGVMPAASKPLQRLTPGGSHVEVSAFSPRASRSAAGVAMAAPRRPAGRIAAASGSRVAKLRCDSSVQNTPGAPARVVTGTRTSRSIGSALPTRLVVRRGPPGRCRAERTGSAITLARNDGWEVASVLHRPGELDHHAAERPRCGHAGAPACGLRAVVTAGAWPFCRFVTPDFPVIAATWNLTVDR